MNGRMLGWLCVVLPVLLLAWRMAAPTAAADTQPTQAVVDLVKKLDADSFQEREKAQADLVGMGEQAEPSLRALLKTDLSAETKARVQAALTKMQDNRLLSPAVITMHYTDAPLQTVMDDFIKQAGADLDTHRKDITDFLQNKKITINVDNVSFWKALQVISKTAGLTLIAPGYNARTKMILGIPGHATGYGGQEVEIPPDTATTAGLFIFMPQCGMWTRWLQDTKDASHLVLTMECACEPKLRLMRAINGDCVQQVIDDKGRDLLAHADGAAGMVSHVINWPSWYLPIELQLKDYPDRAKTIASIKGVIKATVCTKSGTFVVEDVMKPGEVTQKIGSMSVTYTGATVQGHATLLHLSVAGLESKASSPQDQEALAREMELTDADGTVIQVRVQSGVHDADGLLKLTLQVYEHFLGEFDNGLRPLAPKKLVWEIPLDSRPVEVPFELHDLPLPQ